MNIGERLQEERERLTLNQTNFAGLLGVHRKSQANYENNERQPDAAYLAKAASVGIDVLYVLTGMRNENVAGTPTELAYLRNCRALAKVNAQQQGLDVLTAFREALSVDL
jgi:transcriptional regulator with XRE-family HTH domain